MDPGLPFFASLRAATGMTRDALARLIANLKDMHLGDRR
jgi:hypothetical protein